MQKTACLNNFHTVKVNNFLLKVQTIPKVVEACKVSHWNINDKYYKEKIEVIFRNLFLNDILRWCMILTMYWRKKNNYYMVCVCRYFDNHSLKPTVQVN